jgi:hypothetical protein
VPCRGLHPIYVVLDVEAGEKNTSPYCNFIGANVSNFVAAISVV